MVDRQGNVPSAAVLAAMAVATEDVLAGQDDLLVGDPDVDRQPHNARTGHRRRHGMEFPPLVRLHQFHLPQVEEDHRLPHIDDTQGFVVLIQDQNLGIQSPRRCTRFGSYAEDSS